MPKKHSDKNTTPADQERKQQQAPSEGKRGPKEARKGGRPSKQAATSIKTQQTRLEQQERQGEELREMPVTMADSGGEEPIMEAAGEEMAEEAGEEGELAPHQMYPRLPYGNALGQLIEGYFADPASPCRSYSDLERRSGVSREALSRYVTTRADRRRSPTIDTLVAIADALHLSLEEVCRAAAATAKGVVLPPPEVQRSREAVLSSLAQMLSDAQFSAVVELLRQMHPAGGRQEK